MLAINTLGGVDLSLNGERITDIGSHKAEALLIYLAVEQKPLRREMVAALLWPDSSQSKSLSSLRELLSRLRKKVGAYLEITRDNIEIYPKSEIYVDVLDLEDRIASGKLHRVLDLYKGDFLAGFSIAHSNLFEEWQLNQQVRIKGMVINALDQIVSRAITMRHPDDGLEHVQKLLYLDPLNERAHQKCMLLHMMKADWNKALLQYQECCKVFERELGMKPSEETLEIYEKIIQRNFTFESKFDKAISTLPAQLTSFIGREAELYQINQMLQKKTIRLISIVGPGGCGKTRLALEIATHQKQDFPDGTFFVPLENCRGADFILSALAKAINLSFDTVASRLDSETQLIDHLYGRRLLLILDGFEGLVSEAGILSRLLEKIPGLTLLMTSREALALMGEWVYEIEGLSTSIEDEFTDLKRIEAVRLFLARSKQINPDFFPSQSEIERIADICQMVEGMPLAIELAAAWTGKIPINEIEEEIKKNYGFLKTHMLDVPPRHRSIQAVFESSWSLLTEKQRADLCKLSVFHGDFDRKAAYEICIISFDDLLALVDKSLISKLNDDRYKIHDLIHQFAQKRLMQNELLQSDIQNRFCNYFIKFLTDREEKLMGREMLKYRAELSRELINIHAAIRWVFLYWDTPTIRKVLNSLVTFFAVYGWHQGVDTLKEIIELRKSAVVEHKSFERVDDEVIMLSYAHQGFLLSNLCQINESETLSRACFSFLKEAGYEQEFSECLHNLGVNASFRGEYETAKDLLEEAIVIGRDCHHTMWPTYLLWLGHVYFLLGEYEDGLVTLKKCRDLFLEKGTFWGAAFAISKMGLAADGLGEHTQALHFHKEALAVFEQIENEAGKGYSLSRMSMSACFLKDYESALNFGNEAYETFKNLSHRWGLSSSLSHKGFAYLGLGQVDMAREQFLRALEISQDNQLVPLSLFALAGLACVLMLSGQKTSSLELYMYVKQHPKIVTAYLQQACFWIDQCEISSFDWVKISSYSELNKKSLTEVIGLMLGLKGEEEIPIY